MAAVVTAIGGVTGAVIAVRHPGDSPRSGPWVAIDAAISELGSPDIDARLGGIYTLQRLMRDSPRDQPAVVAVLCDFVRLRSASTPSSVNAEPADTQAALTVVLTRDAADDGPDTVVDLSGTDLSLAAFPASAHMAGADLAGAYLMGVSLVSADLRRANLSRAHLNHANLAGANLTGANFTGAEWSKDVPAPPGWFRESATGRLKRANPSA